MSDPGSEPSPSGQEAFHEVLRVPITGWLIALGAVLMCVVAFGAALGPTVGRAPCCSEASAPPGGCTDGPVTSTSPEAY